MEVSDIDGNIRVPRAVGGVRRLAVRCAAGISTFVLGITVIAMSEAQAAKTFKTAPKSAEAEAEAAGVGVPDVILGVEANTLFFIAAGVVALFWFTLGGGRKPKISRE
jgi:hypothetical protein